MYFVGENIELRAIETADYNSLVRMLSKPPIAKHLFGWTQKALETPFSQWLKETARSGKHFYFSIKKREDNALAGLCAYNDMDIKNGSVTIWAAIMPDDRFENVAEEALRILARHAFDQLRIEHVAFVCLENDEEANGWAEKAGFKLDATLLSRIKKGSKRHSLKLYSQLKHESRGGNASHEPI